MIQEPHGMLKPIPITVLNIENRPITATVEARDEAHALQILRERRGGLLDMGHGRAIVLFGLTDKPR